jgi:hypothetical protein
MGILNFLEWGQCRFEDTDAQQELVQRLIAIYNALKHHLVLWRSILTGKWEK